MSLETWKIRPGDPLWNESLQALQYDIYHTPCYLRIEAAREQAAPEALLVRRGDQLLFVPYLVRSVRDCDLDVVDIASPFGYPGILLSAAAERDCDFVTRAHDAFVSSLRSQGACSAFLRLHPILSSLPDKVVEEHATITYGETVSVDLTLTEAQMWSSTRRGHRSSIRRCQRLGFVARFVPYLEHVSDFQGVYTETMHRVRAKQSYYFNEDYFARLASLGRHLHLAVVEMGREVAAAILLFECHGIVQAHLGGTRTEYLNLSPFHLLLHEVRLWAKSRGNQVLHLGGGLGGSNDDPLFHFKAGFSKQRHCFRTLRYVLDPPQYRELVRRRAESLGVPDEELLEGEFFPAYRTSRT